MNAVHSPTASLAVVALFGGRVRAGANLTAGSWSLADSSELWIGSVAAGPGHDALVGWSQACRGGDSGACSKQPGPSHGGPRLQWEAPGATAGTAPWPVARHGHASAVSAGSDGAASLWVFGGAGGACPSLGGASQEQLPRQGGGCLLGDLWVLGLRIGVPQSTSPARQVVLAGWSRVRPAGGGSLWPRLPLWPGPRKHPAMVWTGGSELLLFGGAECLPSCSCRADTWAGTVSSKPGQARWEAVVWPSKASTCSGGRPGGGDSFCPAPRYRHSLTADDMSLQRAAWRPETSSDNGSTGSHAGLKATSSGSPRPGSAWMFGGEAYMPSRYFDDLWRLEPNRRGAVEALGDALLAAAASSVIAVSVTAALAPGGVSVALRGFRVQHARVE